MPKVISLGAWCRPAHQVRRVLGEDTAYPFDWNITSYATLRRIFSPGFAPDQQLRPENLFCNAMGNVTDRYTGMIFAHDVPAQRIGGVAGGVVFDDGPDTLAHLDATRDKFRFLFGRLGEVCRANPVVFLRWLRFGHPDRHLPVAFKDESPHELLGLLKAYCGHDAVRLVVVRSIAMPAPGAGLLHAFQPVSYGANAVLQEYADDPMVEWAGDDAAWTALFERMCDGWLGLPDALETRPTPVMETPRRVRLGLVGRLTGRP